MASMRLKRRSGFFCRARSTSASTAGETAGATSRRRLGSRVRMTSRTLSSGVLSTVDHVLTPDRSS